MFVSMTTEKTVTLPTKTVIRFDVNITVCLILVTYIVTVNSPFLDVTFPFFVDTYTSEDVCVSRSSVPLIERTDTQVYIYLHNLFL